MEAWCKIDELQASTTGTIASFHAVVDKEASTGSLQHSFSLLYSSNEPKIFIAQGIDSNSQNNFYSSTVPLVEGQWHHVAVMAKTGNLYFFFDGAPSGVDNSWTGFVDLNIAETSKDVMSGAYKTIARNSTWTMHGLRITDVPIYPDDGSSFTPPLVYSGLPAGYAPSNLEANDLSDVTKTDGGTLSVDGVTDFEFASVTGQLSDETRRAYNNSSYGLAIGAYVEGANANAGRTYYSTQRGLILDYGSNSDAGVYVSRAGGSAAGETPTVWWAGSNTTRTSLPTHAVGLRLPTEYRGGRFIYELPEENPQGSNPVFLSATGTGKTSWVDVYGVMSNAPARTDTVGRVARPENTTSISVQFDSASVGHLGLVCVGVRSTAVSATTRTLVAPAGWTLLQGYVPLDKELVMGVFTKELEAGDLGVPLTFTTDSPDADDDWHIQGAAYAEAEAYTGLTFDTTPGPSGSSGSIPSNGYDVPVTFAASSDSLLFGFLVNTYALNNATGGTRVTPDGGILTEILPPWTGPDPVDGTSPRRTTTFEITGNNAFNVQHISSGGTPVSLTDGFQGITIRLKSKTVSLDDIDRVVGGTFGSGL